MRTVLARSLGITAYLAFIAGLGTVCVHLARHAGTHAIVLASPYLMPAQGERAPTLVERRQIEAAIVIEANLQDEVTIVPDAPDIALPVLAAQMDVSESADLATVKPSVRSISRTRARHAVRAVRTPAADVFGRSFGVMLMASR
ncbi:hypothetical protein [Hyphomicrobium sp.]|uniref:hypothetical protein n=1 Tax=Hyphomicrobium sp. TaxID=82 RepID=UPI002E376E20|nr:hypothetical protein [Hyphomicrobium sp.]HEX2842390.1 hypothetical protein [Hyphomicrobium sp.]